MQISPERTIKCTCCYEQRPASHFPPGKRHRSRKCQSCHDRTEKPCNDCGITQPMTSYAQKGGKRPGVKDGTCRKCRARRTREWAQRVGPRRARRGMLMRNYGITEIEVAAMLASQGGACAICGDTEMPIDKRTGKPYDLAIDHDHVTGKVRELLCPGCNNGLGCFRDSLERLHKAIAYLEKHSAKQAIS